MCTHLLCAACRRLLNAASHQGAHQDLYPQMNLGAHALYRCRQCGAFACAPQGEEQRWSFNLLGQPLVPDTDGDQTAEHPRPSAACCR